jgi:hypothetical protein
VEPVTAWAAGLPAAEARPAAEPEVPVVKVQGSQAAAETQVAAVLGSRAAAEKEEARREIAQPG